MKDMLQVCAAINELISVLENNLTHINVEATSMWSNSGWHVPSFIYYYFELYYCIAGNAHLNINGREVAVREGDLFFIDTWHGSSCNDGDFTLSYIAFQINNDHCAFKEVYAIIQKCYKMLDNMYPVGKNKSFINYFMSINNESSKKLPNYVLQQRLILMQILVELSRDPRFSSVIDQRYTRAKFLSLVSNMIVYISDNLQENTTLESIASKFHMNPQYLNRVFKSVTGYPILQYQHRLKAEMAKKLLASGTMDIVDVAQELSFSSSQHFSRIFKKITGMSPGQYKRIKR